MVASAQRKSGHAARPPRAAIRTRAREKRRLLARRPGVDAQVGLDQVGHVVMAVQQQQRPRRLGARAACAARSWAMASVVAVPAARSRRPSSSGSTQLPLASGTPPATGTPRRPRCRSPAVTPRPAAPRAAALVLAPGAARSCHPAPTAGVLHHRRRQGGGKQATQRGEVEGAVGQGIRRTGPAAAKDRAQAVAHQAGGAIATEHRIEQLAQRIAPQTEDALVESVRKHARSGEGEVVFIPPISAIRRAFTCQSPESCVFTRGF